MEDLVGFKGKLALLDLLLFFQGAEANGRPPLRILEDVAKSPQSISAPNNAPGFQRLAASLPAGPFSAQARRALLRGFLSLWTLLAFWVWTMVSEDNQVNFFQSSQTQNRVLLGGHMPPFVQTFELARLSGLQCGLGLPGNAAGAWSIFISPHLFEFIGHGL